MGSMRVEARLGMYMARKRWTGREASLRKTRVSQLASQLRQAEMERRMRVQCRQAQIFSVPAKAFIIKMGKGDGSYTKKKKKFAC